MFKQTPTPSQSPTTSDYSADGPIPISRGSNWISLTYIETPWNFTENDEGKKRVPSYWYSLAFLAQHGPIARAGGLRIGGKPAYWGFPMDSDVISVDQDWGDYHIRWRVTKGTAGQPVDPRLNGVSGGRIRGADGSTFVCDAAANRHPSYSGLVTVVFDTMSTSYPGETGSTSIQAIELQTYTLNEVINPGGESERHGVNPVGTVFDLLRNPRYGLDGGEGIAPQSEWLEAARDFLAERGSEEYLSPLFASRSEAWGQIGQIMTHVRGYIPRVGKSLAMRWMSFKPINVSGMAVIHSMRDVVERPKVSDGDTEDVYTSITVKFKDYDGSLGDASLTERSPFVPGARKIVRPTEQDLPFVHDAAQARAWAKRELLFHSRPMLSVEARVTAAAARKPDGSPLFAGDYCVWRDVQIGKDFVCLVESRKDVRGRGITLKLAEVPGQWPVVTVASNDEIEKPQEIIPGVAANVRAWVIPSALWNAGVMEFAVLVDQPDYATAAEVYISESSEFSGEEQELDALTAWTAVSSIAASISETGGVVSFSPGAAARVLNRSFSAAEQSDGSVMLLVGDELMALGTLVSASDGAVTYSVKRGAFGTVAVACGAGAQAWVIERAKLQRFRHSLVGAADDVAWIEVVSRNSLGAAAPCDPVILTDSAGYIVFSDSTHADGVVLADDGRLIDPEIS